VTKFVEVAQQAGLRRPGGYLRPEWDVKDGTASVKLEGVGDLEVAFSRVWIQLLREATHEDFLVEPVGLAEALKVRVITKGHAAAQTVGKSLQKFLFKQLSRHRQFISLNIGGDLPAQKLEEILGKLRGEEEAWLSGDYEAATDNLQSWVSETIMDEICKLLRIEGGERDVYMRLLTGHYFTDADGRVLPQRTGQLMGSIISFPVLCIANFALCRHVMEISRSLRGGRFRPQHVSLQQAQILINGDDLLMKVCPVGRWLWTVLGREVLGLSESLGKTYYSRDFVEMNSRLYQYDDSEKTEYAYTVTSDGRTATRYRFFHETPLINLGLLYGLVRSSAGGTESSRQVSTERAPSLGARLRELYSECHSGGGFGAGVWSKLKAEALELNRTLLGTSPCPWYVPERYGGWGIPGTPTRVDLGLVRAAMLAELHFTTTVSAAWQCWRLANSRLREFGSLERSLGPIESAANQRAVGLLVVDLLFDDSLNISDLLQDPREAAKLAMRTNERLWRKLNSGKYGRFSPRFFLKWVREDQGEVGEDRSEEMVLSDDDRAEIKLLLELRPATTGVPFSLSTLLY